MLLEVAGPTVKKSEALGHAARGGHARCVKLLLESSGPLFDIDDIFRSALSLGRAEVVLTMIGHKPELIDAVDLRQSLAEAVENGWRDFAAALSSIIEKEELASIVSASPARGAAQARL